MSNSTAPSLDTWLFRLALLIVVAATGALAYTALTGTSLGPRGSGAKADRAPDFDATDPDEVGKGFWRAIANRDGRAAYARMDASLQDAWVPDAFRLHIDKSALAGAADATLKRASRADSSADSTRYTGECTVAAGALPCTIHLTQNNGRWAVSGLELDGRGVLQPLEPTHAPSSDDVGVTSAPSPAP